MKKYDIGIISGYFTVLHKGHIEYFKNAKKLCDKLIVIINNNEQQINKKGKLIHNCNDIQYILKHISCIDDVVISIDINKTVCNTLQVLRLIHNKNTLSFMNGGDRKSNNVPEYKTCKDLKIKMIFNVGGKKINSSSNILKRGSNV